MCAPISELPSSISTRFRCKEFGLGRENLRCPLRLLPCLSCVWTGRATDPDPYGKWIRPSRDHLDPDPKKSLRYPLYLLPGLSCVNTGRAVLGSVFPLMILSGSRSSKKGRTGLRIRILTVFGSVIHVIMLSGSGSRKNVATSDREG